MTGIVKIIARHQITIPQEVRAAMNVKPGDSLAWEVGGDGVARVGRVRPLDFECLRAMEAVLVEWTILEDEKPLRDH